MPTLLFFSVPRGERAMTLTVEEAPEDVHAHLSQSMDEPMVLTLQGSPVWINPRHLVYWRDPGPQPRTASF